MLVVATIAAFFLVQHLKVGLPLLAGDPMPLPGTINPVSGGTCWATGPHGKRERISYRVARFSFYLLREPDYVDVDVVDQGGKVVRILATRRYMRTYHRFPDGSFPWDGHEQDGSVAPDGIYSWRIHLLRQHRTIMVAQPVRVVTSIPRPVVRTVVPTTVTRGRVMTITVTYGDSRDDLGYLVVYRLQRKHARPVAEVSMNGDRGDVRWNGTIEGRPAPAGTYVFGLVVTGVGCTRGISSALFPRQGQKRETATLTIREP
jgi:hypothetical protein